MLKLFILFILAAPNELYAAPQGGISEGGGRSVVCKGSDGKIQSARSLDLFEGEQLRGLIFDSSLRGKDEWATAANALKRLARFDALRTADYVEQLKRFRSETRFLPNANLVSVEDSNHVILPENCQVLQAAIQREPSFPIDPRYVIDESIWKEMPVSDRAALVLHEIIYSEARNQGQKDSTKARYFNSVILSTHMKEATLAEYLAHLNAAGFGHSFYVNVGKRRFFLAAQEGATNFSYPGEFPMHYACAYGSQVFSHWVHDDQSQFLAELKTSIEEVIGTETKYLVGYSVTDQSKRREAVLRIGPVPPKAREGLSEAYDHVLCEIKD